MNKIICAVVANSFSLPVPTYSPPPNLPPNRGDSLENLISCKAPIPDLESAIADTGVISIYLTPKAPSAQCTATASAPVTASPTAKTKITATSTQQPAQVQLAWGRKSTRVGTNGSCDRVGGRIT